jgi:hypothetical protein
MPSGGGGEALSGRQFKRPRKRIHSNNDLSRSVLEILHSFPQELNGCRHLQMSPILRCFPLHALQPPLQLPNRLLSARPAMSP